MKDWTGVADAYRRSFALACNGAVRPLLDATQHAVMPTGRPLPHLDVGCGDGRLAAAAESAGRAVSACDPDPQMCALTRERCADLTVSVAALPELPYVGDSFDVVTAAFVLNHVSDPRVCTAELARVARSGGVIAAMIWPSGGAGFGGLLGPVFAHPDVEPLPDQRLPPHLDFERTGDGFTHLFEGAGLVDVEATQLTWRWSVSIDDLWASIQVGVATPGMTYLAQLPAIRAQIETRFRERATTMAENGVLTFTARAVLAVGHHR